MQARHKCLAKADLPGVSPGLAGRDALAIVRDALDAPTIIFNA
jgi:hypothetical protein